MFEPWAANGCQALYFCPTAKLSRTAVFRPVKCHKLQYIKFFLIFWQKQRKVLLLNSTESFFWCSTSKDECSSYGTTVHRIKECNQHLQLFWDLSGFYALFMSQNGKKFGIRSAFWFGKTCWRNFYLKLGSCLVRQNLVAGKCRGIQKAIFGHSAQTNQHNLALIIFLDFWFQLSNFAAVSSPVEVIVKVRHVSLIVHSSSITKSKSRSAAVLA